MRLTFVKMEKKEAQMKEKNTPWVFGPTELLNFLHNTLRFSYSHLKPILVILSDEKGIM